MKSANKVGIIVILLTIFCFLSFKNYPQNPGYKVFDTSNGLVSDEVYDVEIANNGLIWITTDRGVQSYDGYKFKSYSKDDGLQDNVNFEIFESKDSTLWFNGYNGKQSIYSKGDFQEFKFNSQVQKLLRDSAYVWVSNIVISDSTILIAGEGSSFPQLFTFNNEEISVVGKVKIEIKNREKFKYIDFDNYIFSYHNRFQKSNMFLYNKVCATNFDRKIVNNDFSILIKQGNAEKIVTFDHRIEFINNEEESKIWVGTRNGIYCIDLLNNFNTKHYFKNLHVTSIKRDLEGSYWLSTTESGLYWIPSFDFVTLDLSNYTSANERILSISVLSNYLLVGTSGGKLLSIDSLKNPKLIMQALVNKDQITRLDPIDNSTVNSELGKISYRNKQFHVELNNVLPLSYNYKEKYKIQYGPTGFNVKNGNSEIWHSNSFNDPIFSKITATLIEDDWFLTGSHSGLFLTKGVDFSQTKEVKYRGKSISRVSQIISDDAGNIFILTMNNGVYIYDQGKLETLKISAKVDFINAGVFIGKTLWLGTNKGLVRQELSDLKNKFEVISSKRYSIANGLNSNTINNITVWKNDLWLATNKGLCFFDISKQDFEPDEVPLSIDQVLVNDTILINNHALLSHFENKINFTFLGISLKKDWISPFFKFRLEKNGEEEVWRSTDLNEIQFENLGPGSYKFEVKAQNYSKIWNKNSEIFEFKIKAHYTDRIWFKAVLLLSVIGLIALYFLRLLNKNKEKFLLREKMNQVELDARESELSLLRNQMNPHFLFNALNSIQNLIFKNEDEKASQYIAIFGALIRKTLDYTKHRNISLSEELEVITKYLELELMRFPEKFNYTIQNDDHLNLDKIQVPPFLLQPIVENSIVHGFKGINYKGQINIEISDINLGEYCVILTDNGIGLAHKQRNVHHKSIGLKLLQDRLELINQSLGKEITSITFDGNDGMKVIIKLPKTI